jgi:uncharacterized membrane protein required for colicin V production
MSLVIINYTLIFLIAVYVMQGVYKGFLMSLYSTVGMAASWMVAAGVTPLLSAQIAKGSTYSFLLYMTDVSDKVSSVELARTSVDTLSAAQIKEVVDYANLPTPFGEALSTNMQHLSFAQQGYATVADYLNLTVANITVNIMSFLIIYILCRVFISLILGSMYFASPFPVLRNYDGLIGGILGGVRGFFAMFALVMIIPVVILLVAAPELTKYLNESVLATFFYKTNFLYGLISGAV